LIYFLKFLYGGSCDEARFFYEVEMKIAVVFRMMNLGFGARAILRQRLQSRKNL
jgi:hypothetical protein